MKKNKTYYKRAPNGYTLIEMVAVIGVFSVLGVIILSILFTVLRAAKKADLLTSVRESGDLSMSQMINNIRYAKQLNTPAVCTPAVTANSITITSLLDNGQTTYSCPANAKSPITSNSASLTDPTTIVVTNCSFTCQQINQASPPTITIKFTASPATSSNFVENKSSLYFESSVTLRNL